MEKYEKLQQLKDSDFKRLVGVKKETFALMLDVYSKHHEKKKRLGGRDYLLECNFFLCLNTIGSIEA